jgi:hypothetical protein
LNVVGWQPGGAVAAVVSHDQVAAADSSDGPAVAVFDPVGRGEAKSAVVAAGDDHIADTGLVPIR